MKNLAFEFSVPQGKISITVDSLIETFKTIGNTDAVDMIKYLTNEYQLSKQGINTGAKLTEVYYERPGENSGR